MSARVRLRRPAPAFLFALLVLHGCTHQERTPTNRAPEDAAFPSEGRVFVGPPIDSAERVRIELALRQAPYAVTLRRDTDTVRLRVGEPLLLAELPLTMLDVRGSPLGRLPIYDLHHVAGVLDRRGGRDLVAVRPGITVITVAVPASLMQKGLPAPSATLPVVVVP